MNADKKRQVKRPALEPHLKYLHDRELEERDRSGYLTRPQTAEEYLPFVRAASWPKE
jgi:hypothetical protein